MNGRFHDCAQKAEQLQSLLNSMGVTLPSEKCEEVVAQLDHGGTDAASAVRGAPSEYHFIVHCSFTEGEGEQERHGYFDYHIPACSDEEVTDKLRQELERLPTPENGSPFMAGANIYIDAITEVTALPRKGSLLMLRSHQARDWALAWSHAPLEVDENLVLYNYVQVISPEDTVVPFFTV
ncbi:hypothetical protein MicloDRAFT_00037620 [Microvirga lotononidis]|uniref:Uncharacterized protein n=2 Tax=Microvirga lotononidis TaxID=864069 RepID=I4YTB3_9HYPH|nr:hypothetical protein MicloDRAFT_00037620 [Microvirga lotononidis]